MSPELILAAITVGAWVDGILSSAQWWGPPVVSTILVGIMVRLTPTGTRRKSKG